MKRSTRSGKGGEWLRSLVRRWWVLLVLLVAMCVVACALAYRYGRGYWASNTAFAEQSRIVCISPGSTLDDVATELQRVGVLADKELFMRFAQMKGFSKKRYSGRYKIRRGSTTREMLNMLAGRRQLAVRLKVPSVRTREGMAGRLASQLWLDSTRLVHALWDSTFASRFGFTVEEFPAMLVPNTYEVYWDVTLDGLFDRFYREWSFFWEKAGAERIARTGLTEKEISTLASIVQEEVRYPEEMPCVAGVYINRLRAGMALQADPTVRYAVGDFSLKRILLGDTRFESPYNTYIHRGLPPGPIVFPEIGALNAVLNYETHDYLYFCAKEDFSGRHNFSRTGEQHMRYARQYQRALNARGIMR